MTDRPRELHIDFETRSAVDLKKTGVHVYAEDPTTDVWCAAYAFNDEPVKLWSPTGDFPDIPDDIRDHVLAGGIIYAHNAQFERAIWREILTKRYGWPEPKIEQWRCTMAMALAMSLPASLENVAGALGLTIEKDMKGHALMMRMAKPRKRNQDGSLLWWDVPERMERLFAYCKQDVEVERAVHKRLLPLRPSEQRLWWLDQVINDRGVHVDVKLCTAAKSIVAEQQAKLHAAMRVATGGKVAMTSQVAELIRFLNSRGVNTDTVKKEQLGELLLNQAIPDDARKALEIRQEAGKASVSKIDALTRGRARDGRAKGLLQYHAASTGRFAGRRFQPQNLKRPDEETDIDAAIKFMLNGGNAANMDALFGPPLSIIGDCTRGMVCAAPGNKLVTADFSNIEGRVLAWLAGEQWKLDAFAEYDAGRSPDLYIVSYCKTFGVPLFGEKDPRRQLGKVMELASGYQGGHGAYLKMGAKGKKLRALVELVAANTDPDVWEDALSKYEANGAKNQFGLSAEEWVALRIVIDSWRAAHPKIKQFWWDLEDAVVEAVANPGRQVTLGRLKFKKAGSFLFIQLPSGRALSYPYPRLEDTVTPWGATKKTVVYKGVDAYTRKWGDCWLYGGLLAENVTQAVARDLLTEAMERVEAAGYPVVLHVHDEIVAEVLASFGNRSEFERLMAETPAWADGCPVTAKGWEGMRYRK